MERKLLFVAKDKFDGVVMVMACSCAAEFVRFAVPRLARTYYLKDLTYSSEAEIDMKTGKITKVETVHHTWNEYNFPTDAAESIAPLGKDAVEAFKSRVAETKEKSDTYSEE